MRAPIPYVDVPGFKRRSSFSPADVDLFVQNNPGYIEHKIAARSSEVNSQLDKRYLVPLGQSPPELVAQGTTPPPVTLTGRPSLGCIEIAIEITSAGSNMTALFRWSKDGGETWTTGVLASPVVVLAGTGMSANFASGNYITDNTYYAPTPIPEVALGWVVAMVDVDVWDRRGVNAQDPTIARYVAKVEKADVQIAAAANSNEGLFELPLNDAVAASAVQHGGPLAYTEASPYVSADRQQAQGFFEDLRGSGTYGGDPQIPQPFDPFARAFHPRRPLQ